MIHFYGNSNHTFVFKSMYIFMLCYNKTQFIVCDIMHHVPVSLGSGKASSFSSRLMHVYTLFGVSHSYSFVVAQLGCSKWSPAHLPFILL